jgi:phage shock protein C
MKQFTRKREGQMIGGVMSGIAAYFGVDPLLVRLAGLFLFIATGFVPLIIVYAIALVAVPYGDSTNDTP